MQTSETVDPKSVGVMNDGHTQGVSLETADERLGDIWREKVEGKITCHVENLEGKEELGRARVNGVGVS